MTTNCTTKHLLLLVVASLFAANLFVASSVSAQQPTVVGRWGSPLDKAVVPQWKAQWIWMPAGVDADMLLARKTFQLSDTPTRVWLSITASSRYQLFINGHYIRSGPARSAPHHQAYDVLDITDALQKGRNALAIRVHHQREEGSYYEPARAGLLAQIDGTTGQQAFALHTDASWRVHPDESWQNASPPMARFHLEVCDRIDLRRGNRGWTDVDFDAREWTGATVLKRETGWPLPQQNDRPTHLIPPWTSLVARDIPYLLETTSVAKRPVHIVSLPTTGHELEFRGDQWAAAPVIPKIPVPPRVERSILRSTDDAPQPDGPVILAANQPGECRALLFDMGEVQNGRPFLDIVGPEGTVVDIMSAPFLLDSTLNSPIVASTYVDRIVLSGERERWEAFYMKPARWLAVVFRYLPGEASLYQAGVLRSEYPFEQKGSFRTPDFPELQTLWDAAAKTIQVCTTDAYTDNYRERRQYAQTSYYASLGNYSVFGDTALQRRYLRQIAEEQLANGIMPAYAPRHGDDFMVILDSNCLWLRGLHQYLLYSGDRTTTRELLPAARKLLDLLHSYTNSAGLLDSPPYPYWLDHALNDRRGANFCLNGHYLGALEDFAQLLEWLDEPETSLYRQRAARIRVALREQLWVPQKQLFADALVDGKCSDQFSEHANAMALALKIATPEQMQAIALQLSELAPDNFIRRETGIVMVTPAMSYFLHAGLCEAGCADGSWELLQARFAHMVTPQSNGTLWEEWWLDGSGRNGTFVSRASGRSDAQTESAFFPGLFSRYILGIVPTQPGLREVVLRYYPADRLLKRQGAIPTPSGPLEVAWVISHSEFTIALQTPDSTTVKVDLASLGRPRLDHILMNDTPISRDQIENGFLVVAPGDHTVRIQRQ